MLCSASPVSFRRDRVRVRLVLTAVGLATVLAVPLAGCGDDPDGDIGGDPAAPAATPGEQACGAISDYLAGCEATSACDEALLADCDAVVQLLSDPYLAALQACIGAAQSPSACLASSLAELAPTTAQQELASQFCSECAFGVSGCEEQFFSSDSGETAIVGQIILPLGDPLVEQLRTECATGFGCAASFFECAKGVLVEQVIPEQTLSCVLSSVTDPTSIDVSDCAPDGGPTGTGGAGGSGASGAGGAGQGGSGAGGAGSGGSNSGGSGAGGGSSCLEFDPEPNDEIFNDIPVGTLSACNGAPSHTAVGTFGPPDDVDVYRFVGDEELCVAQPSFAITTAASFELVALFECANGNTDVTCPSPAVAESWLVAGHQFEGCRTTEATLAPQLNCTGTTNEDAEVVVMVESDPATCIDYTLEMHF